MQNTGKDFFKLLEAKQKKLSIWSCCRNLLKLFFIWKFWFFSNLVPVVRGDSQEFLSSFKVVCNSTFSNDSSSVVATGFGYAEKLFNIYANETYNAVTYNGLVKLMQGLHIGFHDVENKNNSNDSFYDILSFEINDREDLCLGSASDLLNEFYEEIPHADVRINLQEFIIILPRLVYDLQSSPCQKTDYSDDYDYYNYNNDDDEHSEEDHDDHYHGDHDDHDHDSHSKETRENSLKTWGIALATVAGISLLSVIGIMIVPLMRHSAAFKRLLAFLVALAVGTLIGDALLHLLPHALGGHVHGQKEEEHNKILKSLVAVLAVQVFFNFESIMLMLRERRRKKKSKVTTNDPSQSKSDESLMLHKLSPVDNSHLHPSAQVRKNGGVLYNGVSGNNGKIPPFPLNLNIKDSVKEEDGSRVFIDSPLSISPDNHLHEPLHLHEDDPLHRHHLHEDDPLHRHHHHEDDPLHRHHHHHDVTNAKGVKDLVWMVIAGDGLHNFSDGLAIGAAFTSSISAGLSTSLAVFCHELPHEFGDFAILIDAGLSIRKALAYNALSACIAFAGAIIGLLIGEYTTSVKLWILAITAGGFLYVGLVDMLPQMLKQCLEKDGIVLFIFQNIGLALGISIMLLIAWFEESFLELFNISHGH